MTWSVNTVNNTSGIIVTPSASTLFSEGTRAVIFVENIGYITLLDIGHQVGGPHYWCVEISSGNYSNRWWYDGNGLCTLTINPDGTCTLTGQEQTLNGPIGGGAPRLFQLPATHRVYITGVTNAAWLQRVTMTVNGGGQSMQWIGTGEGNKELANVAIDTPFGTDGLVNAALTMEHSRNGGGSWELSAMSQVGNYSLLGYNLRMVVSEDGADQDYNDSGLSCQWWMLP